MKILAALDQSPYAEFVLNKAIKTARQQNAKLEIMVVAEKLGDGREAFDLAEVNTKLEESAVAAANAYQRHAEAQGMPAKIRPASGPSAAETIIAYQKAENLDLIVLGRRSHKNRDPFPMGHVSQRVAAHATCTVMIVR
ncbi:MAG: universal stress protein [Thermodesulfobacteriota bacterium]